MKWDGEWPKMITAWADEGLESHIYKARAKETLFEEAREDRWSAKWAMWRVQP